MPAEKEGPGCEKAVDHQDQNPAEEERPDETAKTAEAARAPSPFLSGNLHIPMKTGSGL